MKLIAPMYSYVQGLLTKVFFEIFSHAESKFRKCTTNFARKIDSKKMVSELLETPSVLVHHNKLRNEEKVSKEIAFNLLEHLLTFTSVYEHFHLSRINVSYIVWSPEEKKQDPSVLKLNKL